MYHTLIQFKWQLCMYFNILTIVIFLPTEWLSIRGSDGHFEVLNKSNSRILKKWQLLSFWGIKTHFVRNETENLCLLNGHFTTIYGHFFANCIEIFHKTEIQMVILRYLVSLNLICIKNYDILLVKIFFFIAENALF